MNFPAEGIAVSGGKAWPSPPQPGLLITSQTRIDEARSSPAFGTLAEDQVRLSTTYVEAARKRAVIERLEDGLWYAEVPELRGVWSDGADPFACLDALTGVIEDWIVLKLRDHDADFPILDGIDLNQR